MVAMVLILYLLGKYHCDDAIEFHLSITQPSDVHGHYKPSQLQLIYVLSHDFRNDDCYFEDDRFYYHCS